MAKDYRGKKKVTVKDQIIHLVIAWWYAHNIWHSERQEKRYLKKRDLHESKRYFCINKACDWSERRKEYTEKLTRLYRETDAKIKEKK